MWITSRTGSARRILGDLKKSVSWVESSRPKKGDFRLLAEALARCARVGWRGDRWISQNRKNVYLSPYVEEPLNSKVIKSFVPELRSRKCFSCFEIPVFYVYMLRILWTFCVPVWICPFHVFVSGYGKWWRGSSPEICGNVTHLFIAITPMSTLPEVIAPVRVLPMDQIGPFNNLTVCKQMTDVELLVLHSSTWNRSTMCKQMIKWLILNRIIRIR